MLSRQPSPAQIRARAALAVRNRVRRLSQPPKVLPLRMPSVDETPLSLDEMRLAFAIGVAAPSHSAGMDQ